MRRSRSGRPSAVDQRALRRHVCVGQRQRPQTAAQVGQRDDGVTHLAIVPAGLGALRPWWHRPPGRRGCRAMGRPSRCDGPQGHGAASAWRKRRRKNELRACRPDLVFRQGRPVAAARCCAVHAEPRQRRQTMNYADFHRRSIEQPDAFWAEQARLIDWHKPFDTVCDYSRPPFVELVRRRPDQPVPQRGRPPPEGARRQQRADLGVHRSRQGGRLQLPPAARRGAAHGRLPDRAGRQEGRPRADLHADDRRGRLRDAGLRAHRRHPLGGVRRLCQRQPGQPHRQRHADGDRQRRCRQPQRQGGALQGRCSTKPSSSPRTSRPMC